MDMNGKYLQVCFETRCNFTPMVFYVDSIPVANVLAAQRRLAMLLVFNLNQEYSKMCGFVWARMLLAMVIYDSLLLRSPQYKDA